MRGPERGGNKERRGKEKRRNKKIYVKYKKYYII